MKLEFKNVDRKITLSVTITKEQDDFLKGLGINVSKFFRDCIDDLVIQTSGENCHEFIVGLLKQEGIKAAMITSDFVLNFAKNRGLDVGKEGATMIAKMFLEEVA